MSDAVIPGYIGWRHAEPDNANLRFYATDKADDPRWDKFHVGGRVAEYAVLDRDEWGEGDRILIVRAGDRFLSDDDFGRIAAACQAAVTESASNPDVAGQENASSPSPAASEASGS